MSPLIWGELEANPKATERVLPEAELVFNYSESGRKVSVLEPMIGRSGAITARRMTVKALETEDYVITAGITDDGQELDADQARRLFNLSARVKPHTGMPQDGVRAAFDRLKNGVLSDISERNAVFFEEEMEKLDRWAEDKRKSLKTTLKDYDGQIADHKKQARVAPNLPEKLAVQKKIRNLDKKRDEAWRQYDEGAREIERQKDTLIDHVEARLQQEVKEETFFTGGSWFEHSCSGILSQNHKTSAQLRHKLCCNCAINFAVSSLENALYLRQNACASSFRH